MSIEVKATSDNVRIEMTAYYDCDYAAIYINNNPCGSRKVSENPKDEWALEQLIRTALNRYNTGATREHLDVHAVKAFKEAHTMLQAAKEREKAKKKILPPDGVNSFRYRWFRR